MIYFPYWSASSRPNKFKTYNVNVDTWTAEYSRFLCFCASVPCVSIYYAYFKLGKLVIHLCFLFVSFNVKLCIFHQRGNAEIPFASIYSNLSEWKTKLIRPWLTFVKYTRRSMRWFRRLWAFTLLIVTIIKISYTEYKSIGRDL